MRRKDREITDRTEMLDIMRRCEAMSIAFSGDTPYVIPMSFGFEEKDGQLSIYLHGAFEGEKITRMQRDSRVAFSMFTGNRVVESGKACEYTTTYESICGSGRMVKVQDEERRHGLEVLMAHYAPGKTLEYDEKLMAMTCVMRIDVDELTGKRKRVPA